MSGKYFILISDLNGLVLDIEKCQNKPGTNCIMYHRKPDNNANQLWYFDHVTSTVRSRMNNFCLDTNKNDEVVTNPYNASRKEQQFVVDEERRVLCRKEIENTVLDIKGCKKDPWANVCIWQYKGGDNQHWRFEYMPPDYFFIVSESSGLVIQVKGDDDKDFRGKSSLRICTGRRTGKVQEQWFESKYGICSRVNNEPLTSIVPHEKKYMMVKPAPHPPASQHFWTVSGNKIVNLHNTNFVCDIKEASKGENADLIAFPYQGTVNQHWRIEPVQ